MNSSMFFTPPSTADSRSDEDRLNPDTITADVGDTQAKDVESGNGKSAAEDDQSAGSRVVTDGTEDIDDADGDSADNQRAIKST